MKGHLTNISKLNGTLSNFLFSAKEITKKNCSLQKTVPLFTNSIIFCIKEVLNAHHTLHALSTGQIFHWKN